MMKLCERAAGFHLSTFPHDVVAFIHHFVMNCRPPQGRSGPQPVGRWQLPVRRSSRPAEIPHRLAACPAADRLVPNPGQGHRPLFQTGSDNSAKTLWLFKYLCFFLSWILRGYFKYKSGEEPVESVCSRAVIFIVSRWSLGETACLITFKWSNQTCCRSFDLVSAPGLR